jgi:hypothetical protein
MNFEFSARNLEIFKHAELLFSPFENSTCSVNGVLTNVKFEEEEIINFLSCDGNILRMDCNFGHVISERYISMQPEKKSNRGRKKKERTRKTRKYQGDGTCFNSQITFTVLGTHIRKIPFVPDKHHLKTIKVGGGKESVTKEYKIKVFRNGSVTVPGILTEDMSDLSGPLHEICDYLSGEFYTDVKPLMLFSVMRNYKCRLLEGKIDIKKLQKYCEKHFHHLLNTKFSDITEYITNPCFLDMDMSPMYEGWNEVFKCWPEYSPEPSNDDLHKFLSDSVHIKNLYVNFDKLTAQLKEFPMQNAYRAAYNLHTALTKNYMSIDDSCYKKIIYVLLQKDIIRLEQYLSKSKDNMMSHIKYDPEKYPGFLIKVKTPNPVKPAKKTTIKIFPSGKINIDGANNRSEAEYIYYWLNHMFYSNPELIYNEDLYDYNGTDSEFSSDDEEEDD